MERVDRSMESSVLWTSCRRSLLEGDFQGLEGMFTVFLDFNFLLISGPCPEKTGN